MGSFTSPANHNQQQANRREVWGQGKRVSPVRFACPLVITYPSLAHRAIFTCVESNSRLRWFWITIGLKISRQLLNQSEVKPKPTVTDMCKFSRASCRLHTIRVLIGPLDCLRPLWLARSDYFGFGVTTLGYKLLRIPKRDLARRPIWKISIPFRQDSK